MIYEYISESGEIIEQDFKMGAAPVSININGIDYNRYYSATNIIIRGKTPKTIGELAKRNTDKMRKEGKIKEKKKYQPWWRDSKKPDLSLAKMGANATQRYIMEGKK